MTDFVFIFGAGASYGSDTEGTPPLGDDTLLSALRAFNPDGWGALHENLVERFLGDFEAGMRHLSEVQAHAMPPLQRALAAYFFRFVPRRSNLYIALASKIRECPQKEVAFITLNYERLLELSLLHLGFQLVVNREPLNANEIEICFPHGCCHFFCESVRGTSAGIAMSGTGIQTRGRVISINEPATYNNRVRTDAFPPVMSYFESQKRTLSGTNFIDNQRDRLCSIVEQASAIALVGIKIRPNDDHIWNPIASTNSRLVYCSGSEAANEFEEWSNDVRQQGNDLVIRSYFKQAFDQLCEELGLD